MSRARSLPPFITAPTHSGDKQCLVMTEVAVSTATLPEGSFTALALSKPASGVGVVNLLDHDEVENLITLLRNSVDDAKRIDSGQQLSGARH